MQRIRGFASLNHCRVVGLATLLAAMLAASVILAGCVFAPFMGHGNLNTTSQPTATPPATAVTHAPPTATPTTTGQQCGTVVVQHQKSSGPGPGGTAPGGIFTLSNGQAGDDAEQCLYRAWQQHKPATLVERSVEWNGATTGTTTWSVEQVGKMWAVVPRGNILDTQPCTSLTYDRLLTVDCGYSGFTSLPNSKDPLIVP